MNNETQEDLMDLLREVTASVTDLVAELAQPTADLVIATVRVQGVSEIFPALVLLLVVVFGIVPYVIKTLVLLRDLGPKDEPGPDLIFRVPVSFVASFVGLAITGSQSRVFLDVWNWVAIFYPEVYLAHLAIERVLQ